MRLELTVGRVTRGKIQDVNTHKACVEASHDDNGATLTYWTTVKEAPRVGTTLVVTVGGLQEEAT